MRATTVMRMARNSVNASRRNVREALIAWARGPFTRMMQRIGSASYGSFRDREVMKPGCARRTAEGGCPHMNSKSDSRGGCRYASPLGTSCSVFDPDWGAYEAE